MAFPVSPASEARKGIQAVQLDEKSDQLQPAKRKTL